METPTSHGSPQIDSCETASPQLKRTASIISSAEARDVFKNIVCKYAAQDPTRSHRVALRRNHDLSWTGACAACKAYVMIPSPYSELDVEIHGSSPEEWANFVVSEEGLAKMAASVTKVRAEWSAGPQ